MHVQGNTRPDMVCVVQDLLIAVGEEKLAGQSAAAVRDLQSKLGGGLPSLYYYNVPYIPVYIAHGNMVQFGILRASGKVGAQKILLTSWFLCP